MPIVANWASFKPNSVHTVAFHGVKFSSWLCEEAIEHKKDALPVSVANKSCKTIGQKASYTTEVLGYARTNECMVG